MAQKFTCRQVVPNKYKRDLHDISSCQVSIPSLSENTLSGALNAYRNKNKLAPYPKDSHVRIPYARHTLLDMQV